MSIVTFSKITVFVLCKLISTNQNSDIRWVRLSHQKLDEPSWNTQNNSNFYKQKSIIKTFSTLIFLTWTHFLYSVPAKIQMSQHFVFTHETSYFLTYLGTLDRVVRGMKGNPQVQTRLQSGSPSLNNVLGCVLLTHST